MCTPFRGEKKNTTRAQGQKKLRPSSFLDPSTTPLSCLRLPAKGPTCHHRTSTKRAKRFRSAAALLHPLSACAYHTRREEGFATSPFTVRYFSLTYGQLPTLPFGHANRQHIHCPPSTTHFDRKGLLPLTSRLHPLFSALVSRCAVVPDSRHPQSGQGKKIKTGPGPSLHTGTLPRTPHLQEGPSLSRFIHRLLASSRGPLRKPVVCICINSRKTLGPLLVGSSRLPSQPRGNHR